MYWNDLPIRCKVYLVCVYAVALPLGFATAVSGGKYELNWFLFTLGSLFVATINLHLPQVPSVVISMGDVFTILALIDFGPGPALITYLGNVIVTALHGHIRQRGWRQFHSMSTHRLLFNTSCCALSIFSMSRVYAFTTAVFQGSAGILLGLGSIAAVWFLINTATLSLAISLSSRQAFLSIWKEGIGLYVLNFFGSAAAAGLISLFYREAGFRVFLLSLPLAVVLYQLYNFYIEKYEEASKHITELHTLYLQTIEALANAVDAKDRYTHGHIRRVQVFASSLAQCMGVKDQNELMAIKAGALLHDIGKIAIPEYILNKPTALTETEYEKMKIHPVVGANMLSTIQFPYPVIPIVKSHHERWDGNGYPDGLLGQAIPLTARILSLVDCYDALTTNRPYRSPMAQQEVIDFFKRESGKAYDPEVVNAFISNIEQIEAAGRAIVFEPTDVWGITENPDKKNKTVLRSLEKVQPIITYGNALNAAADIQRELYSVFEFARADLQCLTPREIFAFMGRRLEALIDFDAAVFFDADLSAGTIRAAHTIGRDCNGLDGLTLSLEQKLSGWVAANNQALCNLPPFPDFLKCIEPRPAFRISGIAPMNRHNEVLGAISVYRTEPTKFTEVEFRRLEIIASQTAVLLSKSLKDPSSDEVLVDGLTKLPNGFQLYLMFDQVVMDASRYQYPISLLSIRLDEVKHIRQKWGHISGDEAIRAAASYLKKELRDTDLLVRYAAEEFIAISAKMSRDQAEALKSRLQNELDHFRFAVRPYTEIPLPVSVGIAIFPEDGLDLETLLPNSDLRLQEDRDLRSAVRRRVRPISTSG